MKSFTWHYLLVSLLLMSCDQSKQKVVEKTPRDQTLSQQKIVTKGVFTLPLDEMANFQSLDKIQTTEIDGEEYLSFYDRKSRSIYQYQLDSVQLVNKLSLKKEGPDAVNIFFTLDYFFHSMDSIFVDTGRGGYYLLNDKAEVINTIGNINMVLGQNDGSLSLGSMSYFSGDYVYGGVRISYPFKDEAFINSMARMRLQRKLEVESFLKTDLFVPRFDEIMSYRKEMTGKGKILLTIPRQLLRKNRTIYATTPLSDSLSVFENNELVKRIYAGIDDQQVTDFESYLNINQVIRSKGEVRRVVSPKQSPYFINTLIAPDGRYIYRVLTHGTRPGLDPESGEEVPQLEGATLLMIDLESEKKYTLALPVNQLDIKTPMNNQVFVTKNGIHFRLKDQENEDQAEFQVFGIQ